MDGRRINTSNFEDAANFDVSAIAPDSSNGYIFEVDLEYPQHHDTPTYLSAQCTINLPPGKREDKLLATSISSVTSFTIAIYSNVVTVFA